MRLRSKLLLFCDINEVKGFLLEVKVHNCQDSQQDPVQLWEDFRQLSCTDVECTVSVVIFWDI